MRSFEKLSGVYSSLHNHTNDEHHVSPPDNLKLGGRGVGPRRTRLVVRVNIRPDTCLVGGDAAGCGTGDKGDYGMMIYGLQTCALCQKARRALEAEGLDVSFRDVRAEPLSEAELSVLIEEFGDRLVDRKSNDYRGLNDWLKNSEADAQIAAQPKVMARPVIRHRDQFFLGWDEAVRHALLASS